ncbi:hypothetical protein D3C81_1222970 [compost metagenome]
MRLEVPCIQKVHGKLPSIRAIPSTINLTVVLISVTPIQKRVLKEHLIMAPIRILMSLGTIPSARKPIQEHLSQQVLTLVQVLSFKIPEQEVHKTPMKILHVTVWDRPSVMEKYLPMAR